MLSLVLPIPDDGSGAVGTPSPNWAQMLNTAIADLNVGKLDNASTALSGTPTAPTPPTVDNSTRIATTAFVKAQTFSKASIGLGSVDNTSDMDKPVSIAQAAAINPPYTPIKVGAADSLTTYLGTWSNRTDAGWDGIWCGVKNGIVYISGSAKRTGVGDTYDEMLQLPLAWAPPGKLRGVHCQLSALTRRILVDSSGTDSKVEISLSYPLPS